MMLPGARRDGGWSRFVAIGDSFTEGMCDAVAPSGMCDDVAPSGMCDEVAGSSSVGYAGWADRLARHLARRSADGRIGYANLAVRGRLLADVVGPQLDAALALGPDLLSINGGGNDCLRPGADPQALAAALEAAVVRARAAGADVLLGVPADPRDSPFVRRTRGTVAAYAMHIWSIAGRHDCYLMDLWGFEPLRDWRMWAPDRIHLSSEGHRRTALRALESLGIPVESADWQDSLPAEQPSADPADWAVPLPARPAPARRETLAADAQWAREYAGPWVARRIRGRSSGDGRRAKRPDLRPFPES